ncbi:hypothetical protein O3G_MSEX004500 [Manduca sexta]|uniref:Uncharacterized protein n=1 Tax=Manduca sexta TaxID=7130 RepID=A0A921YVS0_MANSE|nr:hypothetical protein O3G_MSEX004500 [Manduca sexta]
MCPQQIDTQYTVHIIGYKMAVRPEMTSSRPRHYARGLPDAPLCLPPPPTLSSRAIHNGRSVAPVRCMTPRSECKSTYLLTMSHSPDTNIGKLYTRRAYTSQNMKC